MKEKYQKLIGSDTKNRSLEYAELEKDSAQRAIDFHLREYAKKHFKSLLGEIDERNLAKLVSDKYNTEHNEIVINSKDLLTEIEDMFYYLDEISKVHL